MLNWRGPQVWPDGEVSWHKNKQALALIELVPAHSPIFPSAQPNSCIVVEVATSIRTVVQQRPQRLWGGSTGAGHPSNSGVDSLWTTRQTREESEECLENRQLKLNLVITVQQKKKPVWRSKLASVISVTPIQQENFAFWAYFMEVDHLL